MHLAWYCECGGNNCNKVAVTNNSFTRDSAWSDINLITFLFLYFISINLFCYNNFRFNYFDHYLYLFAFISIIYFN
jgi:hypothetical protein